MALQCKIWIINQHSFLVLGRCWGHSWFICIRRPSRTQMEYGYWEIWRSEIIILWYCLFINYYWWWFSSLRNTYNGTLWNQLFAIKFLKWAWTRDICNSIYNKSIGWLWFYFTVSYFTLICVKSQLISYNIVTNANYSKR